MRRFGPILALIIAGLLAGVGYLYWSIRQRQVDQAAPPPARLDNSLNSQAKEWAWSQTVGGKTVVEVRAKDFRQVKDPPLIELNGVELKIFHGEENKFDRVSSAKAHFSIPEGKMVSDGEVDIKLGDVPDGVLAGRLMNIHTAGVTFQNQTGKADTDKHATFVLDVGDGEADGATYDPQTRELRLKSNVKLNWRGKNPKALPMLIQAGELIYKEVEHKVWLLGWTKFSRDKLTMSGGASILTIDEGNLRLIETVQASGSDQHPDRTVDFGADQLQIILAEGARIEKISGQTNARLNSVSKTGRTRIRSQRLDLSFVEEKGDVVLSQALANGAAVAESFPTVDPKPENRVLKSDAIELKMKPGGREVATMDTHAPGTLEFLPNQPTQRKRRLDAERMNLRYGANNQMEYFRAVKVTTHTDPAVAPPGKPPAKPSAQPQTTSSENLEAGFDAKGDLARLEQWGNFRYQEGDRHAVATRAVLDQPKNLMTLTGDARVWDAAGSTDAESIVINQTSGDTVAQGRVRTVRDPHRAVAQRMVTSGNNSKIRYQGQATVWQNDNKLDAEIIDIDRASGTLAAQERVVSMLQDKSKVVTVIRAAKMDYSDKEKVAFYSGDVFLTRPQLTVKSKKLRAYLVEEDAESSATLPDSGLDRAFAEGSVEIIQTNGPRTRQGLGEAVDYYVTDGRVILEGGAPQLTETQPGVKPNVTKGRRLTWLANSDKLTVEGAEQTPGSSTLRRKKPQPAPTPTTKK